MRLPARLAALFLAFMPMVWGLCPCGIIEMCAQDGLVGTNSRSSCCPDDDGCPEDAPQNQHPTHPGPCKGCALMEAGLGVVPPIPLALPVPTLAVGLPVLAFRVDGVVIRPISRLSIESQGAGPPRNRSASVVLLI